MRRLYSGLMILLAPLAFAVVLARGLRDRAYWIGLRERFGWGPEAGASHSIWLHAVSMGEVGAAAPLLRALRARHPRVPLVLSTSTPTGRARARALFASDVDVRFLPYDTPGSVERFLERIRPRAAIIMETELWPNLLAACRRRGVPILLANARLAARSAAWYRRLGRLFGDAVAAFDMIAAQTPTDAERFVAIGAAAQRTQVVGNMKFDLLEPDARKAQGRELRLHSLGARPVWIAGSTHEGEEAAALDAHALVVAEFPNALLVLVPRHPQRFESVARLLERRGCRFERRSAARAVRPDTQVLLVDGVGELAALYGAADVAFVGGSLVPIGGHNLLEAAALGIPVVTGPYNSNARDIARALVQSGGAIEIAGAEELAGVLRRFLGDAGMREQTGERGREFVERHRGSIARLLALIDPMLAAAPPNP